MYLITEPEIDATVTLISNTHANGKPNIVLQQSV